MTTRWVLLCGLLAAVLAGVLGLFVMSLLLGEDEATETEENSPARCEAHGILPPDPRAQPDRVTGIGVADESGEPGESGGPDGAAEAIQLDQEFTSGDTTSSYHLFTRGVDFDEPVGVVVRLHGDGGAEFENPDGLLNCLAAVAASQNMVLLAPLTPDVQGEVTWWQDISTNLPWLNDLLTERVTQSFPVDPERVWWMGYSGGAEMITYGVLPRTPEVVTGGAVMIGGGGAPQIAVEEPSAEQRLSLDLIWVTGTLDDGSVPYAPFDAVTATREGSAWYRQQGFKQVMAEYPEGEDHFSLQQARILDEALTQ
ncbi:hypothetical protein BG28_12850 [Nesterenkonia sp. AN1]|uniref:hypothetical protein n=1 Tax=Nesterenkonia sp. AN1 TaxID=652017 RepID=UPI0004516D23|nr:hypothetical protein [Nesterenkonia sp. AN1]EXF25542.1 hypothetical protein BG28_12850 [Nesterenkonia sp. AN1]